MSGGDTDMMGSKENHFTHRPLGMSPMKQRHIKASSKDTELLHGREMRWKKHPSPQSTENSTSFALLPQTKLYLKRS